MTRRYQQIFILAVSSRRYDNISMFSRLNVLNIDTFQVLYCTRLRASHYDNTTSADIHSCGLVTT